MLAELDGSSVPVEFLGYACRSGSQQFPEIIVKQKLILASSIALLALSATASADITTTETNNGTW